MAVLLTKDSKVIVQGITGHQGRFHATQMKAYGTQVVGGVTPGKGGTEVEGMPVFDTVREAVEATGADTSCVFVPAPFARDAVHEALSAGIGLAVTITEHVPVHDAIRFVHTAQAMDARVVGPNCPGLASPTQSAKVGIAPNHIFSPGPVGVVSRSGTLTYEIVDALTQRGLGQTSCVGIGGDPVPGTTFVDALELFEADPETKAIVLVGEIGGTAEEDAAAFIREHVSKPVFAYVAGKSAPEGKTMGHAGAIVTRGKGTAASKKEAFAKADVPVVDFATDIADLVAQAL